MNGNRRTNLQRIGLIVAVLIVLLFCFTIATFGTTWGKIAYANIVLGNREHGVDYMELPTEEIVAEVLIQHQETVRQLESISPNAVFVGVGESNTQIAFPITSLSCERHADVLINVDSYWERREVETILGDTFFGIPYRVYNR